MNAYAPTPSAPTPPAQRWFPLAFGLVAVAGLVSTLLPMWSIKVGERSLGRDFTDYGDAVTDKGNVIVHVGFYDWVVSGRPVGAVLPLVLALAIAVAVAAALCVPDRTWWGITAAVALCAVIIVGGTAIHPKSTQEVTGQIAGEMSPSEAEGIRDPAPMDASVGPGLVLALLSVAVVGGLAAWQYLGASATRDAGVYPPG